MIVHIKTSNHYAMHIPSVESPHSMSARATSQEHTLVRISYIHWQLAQRMSERQITSQHGQWTHLLLCEVLGFQTGA